MKPSTNLIIRLTIILTAVLVSPISRAQEALPLHPANIVSYFQNSQMPTTFYHWTTERHLQTLQAERIDEDALGLRDLVGDKSKALPTIVSAVPDLLYRQGIFISANPVTGIAFNDAEIYARKDSRTGSAPLLLILKLKPQLRRALVITNESAPPVFVGNPTRVDIIHHVFVDNMGVAMQEWILTNPQIVESATAELNIVRPILEQKLREVRAGQLRDPVAERHSTMSLSEAAMYTQNVLDMWDSNISRVEQSVPPLFSGAPHAARTCPIVFR